MAAADLALLDPEGAFLSRMAEDRAALAGLAGGLWKASPEARRRRLAEIEVLAHRLGGAAGTFGYEGVSAAALELEDRIAMWRQVADPSGCRVAIEGGLTGLARALEGAIAQNSA
jgi:HPt (histidine-containing phosphotransfer) domain-containing protein